jgi:hypothetical protein
MGSSGVFYFQAVDFVFDSGTQYYLGCKTSATVTVRAVALTSCYNMGLGNNGGSATTFTTVLRKSSAFNSAAPDPWGFVNSDRVSALPPAIRFRAADL